MKPKIQFYFWMFLRASFATIVVLWLNFSEWFKASLFPGYGGVCDVGWPLPVNSWGAIIAIYTPVSRLWRSFDFWIDLTAGLSIILVYTYLFRNGLRPWWRWIRTVGLDDIREPG